MLSSMQIDLQGQLDGPKCILDEHAPGLDLMTDLNRLSQMWLDGLERKRPRVTTVVPQGHDSLIDATQIPWQRQLSGWPPLLNENKLRSRQPF